MFEMISLCISGQTTLNMQASRAFHVGRDRNGPPKSGIRSETGTE